MKLAFITREITNQSAFAQKLRAAGWSAEGHSLVQFSARSVSVVPQSDWWFFYSQQAVRFFLTGRNLPPLVKLGAIGISTAEAIERYTGHTPDFCGNGVPEDTAKAFLVLAKKQKVLFPGAAHSMHSIERLLENEITALPLPVYDNVPVKNPPDMQQASALVFTSPMNVRAYLAHFPVGPEQAVVAIGSTTAAALEEAGITNIIIASEPNEEALAKAVITTD